MNDTPLVSIGMPTYNRASSISRSIESALAQDYANIELVISDNASTDGTQAVCEEFVRRDPRVRYIRQAVNQGATANFHTVLREARGEFFMWLSDDDWLDLSYVSQCAKALRDTKFALVCGRAKYFQGSEQVNIGERSFSLPHRDAWRRVLLYYRKVSDNGTFYGLIDRSLLLNAAMPNVLGGDWLLIAGLAFQGKVQTLGGVHINRSASGSSTDPKRLAAVLGLSLLAASNPCFCIAVAVFKDIAWQSPTYRSASKLRRFLMACGAAAIVYLRFSHWDRDSLAKWILQARFRLALRTRLKEAASRFPKF